MRPAPPPQANKGYRPRAPKARSPTGGYCPRNPRRASPSRPTGGPLPRHKSKNSGRSTPKPTTTAQSPAVLTPTGRFAALSGGQRPPAPFLESSFCQVARAAKSRHSGNARLLSGKQCFVWAAYGPLNSTKGGNQNRYPSRLDFLNGPRGQTCGLRQLFLSQAGGLSLAAHIGADLLEPRIRGPSRLAFS